MFMRLFTAVALVFGVTATASAAPAKGDKEIALLGSGFASSDFTAINVQATYGYFASDQLLWEFGVNINGSEIDAIDDAIDAGGGGADFGSTNSIIIGGLVGMKYHFNTTGDTGYLRGSYRVSDFDEVSDTQFVDVYYGYNWYRGNNSAFFAEVGYGQPVGNDDADGTFITNFGFKFFLN